MGWMFLLIAGAFEVTGAVLLEYTEGFTRPGVSVGTVGAFALSLAFMSKAIATIPLGTAYAIWTGIGVVGVALFGVLVLGESYNALRLGCIALILIGMVGLKLIS